MRGRYYTNNIREIGMTIGANAKARMGSKEFVKYLKAKTSHLYPDASDTPRKRVVMIVDSGPSRLNEVMLAQLRVK